MDKLLSWDRTATASGVRRRRHSSSSLMSSSPSPARPRAEPKRLKMRGCRERLFLRRKHGNVNARARADTPGCPNADEFVPPPSTFVQSSAPHDASVFSRLAPGRLLWHIVVGRAVQLGRRATGGATCTRCSLATYGWLTRARRPRAPSSSRPSSLPQREWRRVWGGGRVPAAMANAPAAGATRKGEGLYCCKMGAPLPPQWTSPRERLELGRVVAG